MKIKIGVMKNITIFIALIIILLIIDFMNLPTLLGLNMSNINWDFCMGIINVMVVILLYLITYKVLDERTILREKNKNEISMLLIKNCYHECINYIQLLSRETVEKYIVPKIDFNSTPENNTILGNIQNAPFLNESIIFDLVKDGQITKSQIEAYLNIKDKYKQYVNMRIILFDAEQYYKPLETNLIDTINREVKEIESLL